MSTDPVKSERPSADNTAAVIVSYNPDAGFTNRVKRLAQHVAKVLIVDNHSGHPSTETLRRLSFESRVNLVLNDSNLGVATALNQGVRWAKQLGYRWLLTFDQDTIASDHCVGTAAQVYDQFPHKDAIAVIGAQPFGAANGRRQEASESDWIETRTVITSGTLMSLEAFDVIGPFRDEFFIDLVDLEYCLRARQKGFKVLLSLSPSMHHQIGATTTHALPWKDTGTSNHSPLRRYYMMRNHTVLALEYLLKDPVWVATSMYSRIKSTILMCLFEPDRLAKLRFTGLGLWDGLILKFNRDLSART